MSNIEIKIKIAEDCDLQRWDDFVLGHPYSSPYHLFAWKKSIESAYGHKCRYFYLEQNQKILGVMPLIHFYFPKIVNEIIGLPYCDVGNCLIDREDIQDILLNKLFNIIKNSNIKKIQLRGEMYQSEMIRSQMHPLETGKVRMIRDLPPSSDQLLQSFPSKLRSQIKKAKKNGVSFQWGNLEDLDSAYYVFSKNMHELGSPVHSKSFMKAILSNYGNHAKLGITFFNGKLVGMGIILLAGAGVSIPWASTLREFNRYGPNMLLYWNFLKYSSNNGYAFFDFGRSSINEGTFKFKKQWGAKPIPLIWYDFFNKQDDHDAIKGNKYLNREKFADLWRKVPFKIANMIGPHIRKYISL